VDEEYLSGWDHGMNLVRRWRGRPNSTTDQHRDEFVEARLTIAESYCHLNRYDMGTHDALLHYQRHGDYRARPPRGDQ
jgi:hypothetical protein